MNYNTITTIIPLITLFLLGAIIGFILGKTLYYRKGIKDTVYKLDKLLTDHYNKPTN